MKDSTKYTLFINFVISRQILNYLFVKIYGIPLFMVMDKIGF